MLIHKFKAFFKKDFLLEKKDFIDCIIGLLATFLFIGIFYFVAKIVDRGSLTYFEQYGSDYFSFVFIGVIFIQYLYLILANFSRDIREYRLFGILEAMLATPTKSFTLLLGMNFWNVFFATLEIIILLFLGRYFLGVKIDNPHILASLLILILTASISVTIGFISAALSILFFKKRDPIVFLINCSTSLLCGVYFPISLLPESLQRVSYVLPMTYALSGLRRTLLGGYPVGSLFYDLMILAISLTVLIPTSFAIFNYALKKIKIEGRASYG